MSTSKKLLRWLCAAPAGIIAAVLVAIPLKRLAQRRQKAVDFTKGVRRLLKTPTRLVQQRWAESDRLKRSTASIHIYEIRPRTDKHGVDLISDAFPYSPLWYRGPKAISDAIDYIKFFSGSQGAVIRVYDEAGNVIETLDHKGDFKEP